MFDVSLFYKLIWNLCLDLLLGLINKWGKILIKKDMCVVDDIEWIRYLRNELFVYVVLVEILDDDFKEFWYEVKCLI